MSGVPLGALGHPRLAHVGVPPVPPPGGGQSGIVFVPTEPLGKWHVPIELVVTSVVGGSDTQPHIIAAISNIVFITSPFLHDRA